MRRDEHPRVRKLFGQYNSVRPRRRRFSEFERGLIVCCCEKSDARKPSLREDLDLSVRLYSRTIDKPRETDPL
jgi:hypothetical protein